MRIQTALSDKLKNHSSHHEFIPDWMHDCVEWRDSNILIEKVEQENKQRMNKEEKCCGNFHWFDNEDIYGVGWCTTNSCDVSCNFFCIRHIN